MRYRKLSADGDYVFGNSGMDFYVNSPATIGQAVKTGLLLWMGEWFLDNTLGMPWMESVLGKHSKEIADAAVRNQISNTIGVVDISEFSSSIEPEERAYSVQCSINTIYGPTAVQIANYINF